MYSNRRKAVLAVLLLLLVSTGGCAAFHKEFWSLDRYRDERAVEIDHRLNNNEPVVKSPF